MLALVYCLSVAYGLILMLLAERTGSEIYTELARQLPGQLSYFMAGGFFYYYLSLFERRIGYFLAVSVFVLTIDMIYPLAPLEPFALAAVVIYFGLFMYAGNFGKYGDFSYGVYILHFPVIQLLLHADWFHDNPWYFLTSVIFTTAAGAIVLWHVVEKRFLLRSNHYVATIEITGAGTR